MLDSFKNTEKIKENEMRALLFFENNKHDSAEKMLLENLDYETDSPLTYNLLIRIYSIKKNYQGLINILNIAIKKTGKKTLYRNLKKQLIISKILKDAYNSQ